MSFTSEERKFITFFEKPISHDEIENHVSKDVYTFLKENKRLHTVADRVIISGINDYRITESCQITKFITPDVNIEDYLNKLTKLLVGPYLIFVDCHFLIQCPGTDDTDVVLKFQQGSKASSFNDIMKIYGEKDQSDFISQFKNLSAADILNECFISHVELFNYEWSGLMPFSLLSLLVHVQKIYHK